VSPAVWQIAESARQASRQFATIPSVQRDAAIRSAADAIEQTCQQLLEANAKDLAVADVMLTSGEINLASYERLRLTDKKIADMSRSMRAVASLPDPLGRVLQKTELDTGLVLEKISCPIGVLAVIFEARPDAVTQISALALKSGNAVILKPGHEVEHTASLLFHTMRHSFAKHGIAEDSVSLIAGREAVGEL